MEKNLLDHILYLETLFFPPVYYGIRIWLPLQEMYSLSNMIEALIFSQVILTYFTISLYHLSHM